MKESCLEFNKLQRPNKCISYRLRVAATFADKISTTSVKIQLEVRSQNIDLVTVFDAILTSKQTREKLQCLYENLMSNNLRITVFLKKI